MAGDPKVREEYVRLVTAAMTGLLYMDAHLFRNKVYLHACARIDGEGADKEFRFEPLSEQSVAEWACDYADATLAEIDKRLE